MHFVFYSAKIGFLLEDRRVNINKHQQCCSKTQTAGRRSQNIHDVHSVPSPAGFSAAWFEHLWSRWFAEEQPLCRHIDLQRPELSCKPASRPQVQQDPPVHRKPRRRRRRRNAEILQSHRLCTESFFINITQDSVVDSSGCSGEVWMLEESSLAST